MSGNNDEAVILLGHGSRVPGAGKNMEEVAQRLRELGCYGAVETCYMERLGPHLPEALEICVKSGARRIILIPYFLHMGLHTRVDIPNMMRGEAEKYPHVTLIFGKNLGYDELILELVKKRISESRGFDDVRRTEKEERERYPLPPDASVFVPMSQDEALKFVDNNCNHHHHEH